MVLVIYVVEVCPVRALRQSGRIINDCFDSLVELQEVVELIGLVVVFYNLV